MPKIPLPENQGFLFQPAYDAKAFSRDVIASFPELKEDLEDFADLLHIQVGTLADCMRSSLKSGDSILAMRILKFLEKSLTQPEPTRQIKIAIAESFISVDEIQPNADLWQQCQSTAPLVSQILVEAGT
jgi:hypothetical protein